MLIIRILAGILSVGGEIYGACLLVHLQDFLHMPRALGDAVLHISLIIIEIQMCPSVAFASLDQLLAASKNLQVAGFLICVHAFFDHRDDAVAADCV